MTELTIVILVLQPVIVFSLVVVLFLSDSLSRTNHFRY